MYYGENKGISIISIVCSVMNIILNIIFIPIFGYFAAGWTTLLCYMLLTLLHYILMRRACRIHHLKGKVFQDKVLLAISGGVVILSFAAMGLYRLAYLRYGALICAAAVLFAFRKKLLPILKQMSRGGENHEE